MTDLCQNEPRQGDSPDHFRQWIISELKFPGKSASVHAIHPHNMCANYQRSLFVQRILPALLLTLAMLADANHVSAQGTAFTYQGRLTDGGNPANGAYDLTFTLFNASSGGATLGASNVFNDLLISNGLFTVTLEFGAQFDGNARWLQV